MWLVRAGRVWLVWLFSLFDSRCGLWRTGNSRRLSAVGYDGGVRTWTTRLIGADHSSLIFLAARERRSNCCRMYIQNHVGSRDSLRIAPKTSSPSWLNSMMDRLAWPVQRQTPMLGWRMHAKTESSAPAGKEVEGWNTAGRR